MNKFKTKYRIPSARLQSWNYGWNAAYFITICTHDRKHYFGEVNNGKMQLSQIGVIADILWYELKNHFKNIILDSFVVMPNHIHGILILNGDDNTDHDVSGVIDVNNGDNVETRYALSLLQRQNQNQQPQPIGKNRFQNQGKNTVSSIIGSYKSAVTKHSHRLNYEFKWQSRFYDHIIRDEKSFSTISVYIINNPSNWVEDKFYKHEKTN